MVDTSKQEYRSYGGCLLLYFPAGIPFKQVGFRAVQQKGQGYDCRERIKWRITYNLFPSYLHTFLQGAGWNTSVLLVAYN